MNKSIKIQSTSFGYFYFIPYKVNIQEAFPILIGNTSLD